MNLMDLSQKKFWPIFLNVIFKINKKQRKKMKMFQANQFFKLKFHHCFLSSKLGKFLIIQEATILDKFVILDIKFCFPGGESNLY